MTEPGIGFLYHYCGFHLGLVIYKIKPQDFPSAHYFTFTVVKAVQNVLLTTKGKRRMGELQK